MKILGLWAGYPDNSGSSALGYVKVRNHYNREEGIKEIIILNFSLKKSHYDMDGFNVISLFENKNTNKEEPFDILIFHAPNIRNHFRFLRKFQNCFPKIVFFFKGHGVLSIKKETPKSYAYQKALGLKCYFSPLYDALKLRLWLKYFIMQGPEVHLVFVSEWIHSKFEEYLNISLSGQNTQNHLIYKCVSKTFEKEQYDVVVMKKFDYISVKNNVIVISVLALMQIHSECMERRNCA